MKRKKQLKPCKRAQESLSVANEKSTKRILDIIEICLAGVAMSGRRKVAAAAVGIIINVYRWRVWCNQRWMKGRVRERARQRQQVGQHEEDVD